MYGTGVDRIHCREEFQWSATHLVLKMACWPENSVINLLYIDNKTEINYELYIKSSLKHKFGI